MIASSIWGGNYAGQRYSELNQITSTAVGHAVRVSDDLFTVLAASQDLAEATDGAFDVTQGPVIRVWREARKTSRLPDADTLREAASRSGHRKLHLDAAAHTVLLDQAGMGLDVGAIGKGYAASERRSKRWAVWAFAARWSR